MEQLATSTQTRVVVLPGLEQRAVVCGIKRFWTRNTSKTETGSTSIAASRPISTARRVAAASTASYAFRANIANYPFSVFCSQLESFLNKGSKHKSKPLTLLTQNGKEHQHFINVNSCSLMLTRHHVLFIYQQNYPETSQPSPLQWTCSYIYVSVLYWQNNNTAVIYFCDSGELSAHVLVLFYV